MTLFDPAGLHELKEAMPDYWATHFRRFEETLKVLLGYVPAGGGREVLDLGVYPGFMAKLAVDAGFKVSGVSSEEMTPWFRSFAEKQGIGVSQRDIETDILPFEDNRFAAVLFTEVVEHLHRNPYHPIAEAYRVLEPGGILIVTTPNLCRWDTLRCLLSGKSFHPSINGDFYEAFPVNPNYKHCREYVASELVYLLAGQNLYPYRYEIERIRFSGCWDTRGRDVLGSLRRFDAVGRRLTAWIFTALFPRLRSNLVAVARKPRFSCVIPASVLENAEGFHAVEADTDDSSSHRRRLETPFRWTTGRASVRVRLPSGTPGKGLRLRLGMGYIVPKEAGARTVEFAINGKTVSALNAVPSKTYTVVDLPADLPAGSDTFRLDVTCRSWRPADIGLNDERELGVTLSWGDWLLYAASRRLPTNGGMGQSSASAIVRMNSASSTDT